MGSAKSLTTIGDAQLRRLVAAENLPGERQEDFVVERAVFTSAI
jgi:hypothetical protein